MTDNVKLVKRLAEGSMGSVWVADHLSLDTKVAVKFISQSLGDQADEALRRFEMEAKAAAAIKSPHVVQVFDHGFLDGEQPFIVMELLEGESLAERLDRDGWVSFEECVEIVRQVCKALHKAHELYIFHRDVKPDNIFLSRAGDEMFVKLLDFGVAKSRSMKIDGGTDPGVMIGTAEYMSREQVISGREVDHQADLWSLAVVAYEAITGDVPFTGETLGLICVAICNAQFVPPTEQRKGVPAALDAFFKRAFASDPSRRFASARTFARAFRKALGDSESESSRPPIAKTATMVAGSAPPPSNAEPAASSRRPQVKETLASGTPGTPKPPVEPEISELPPPSSPPDEPPPRESRRPRKFRRTALGIGVPTSVAPSQPAPDEPDEGAVAAALAPPAVPSDVGSHAGVDEASAAPQSDAPSDRPAAEASEKADDDEDADGAEDAKAAPDDDEDDDDAAAVAAVASPDAADDDDADAADEADDDADDEADDDADDDDVPRAEPLDDDDEVAAALPGEERRGAGIYFAAAAAVCLLVVLIWFVRDSGDTPPEPAGRRPVAAAADKAPRDTQPASDSTPDTTDEPAPVADEPPTDAADPPAPRPTPPAKPVAGAPKPPPDPAPIESADVASDPDKDDFDARADYGF